MAERSSAFAICRQDTNVSPRVKSAVFELLPMRSPDSCRTSREVADVPISGSRFPLPESEFRVLAAARLISAMA